MNGDQSAEKLGLKIGSFAVNVIYVPDCLFT